MECGLFGVGLYGLMGLHLVISKKLINVKVQPKLTYSLECLTFSTKEIEPIAMYY